MEIGNKNKLFDILNTIEGGGNFATSSTREGIFPGMVVEGFGEVPFPLVDIVAQSLIGHAEQAPFGKGSRTVIDTKIRNSWEIDASKVSFTNKKWEPFLKKIVQRSSKELGIDPSLVKASPYKLLIYEKGGFFLPHRDSEKEKGMFGTLVVCLPSQHTGGELVVRFEGQEKTYDFAAELGERQICHAAFYADCEHELKKVRSGYRICMVYNLVQTAGKKRISSPRFLEQSSRVAEFLKANRLDFEQPTAILLGHQYTPSNFSLDRLKNKDLPRAEALLLGAREAGFIADLGLVTSYIHGDIDWNTYRNYNEDSAELGDDIYEEYINLSYWGMGDVPGLGELDFEEEDIVRDIEINEGSPAEKAVEGYTGNAGMTIEYWYHYGAVIIWPKDDHLDILLGSPIDVKLEWLDFYNKKWQDKYWDAPHSTKELLKGMVGYKYEGRQSDKPDFSPLAKAFAKLDDKDFTKEYGSGTLANILELISVESWRDLLKIYPKSVFSPIFKKAMARKNKAVLLQWLHILDDQITNKGKSGKFVSKQIAKIPLWLGTLGIHPKMPPSAFDYTPSPSDTDKAIPNLLIKLSQQNAEDTEWMDSCAQHLTQGMTRQYLHEVLCPAILTAKDTKEFPLAEALSQVVTADLQGRTEIKPQPPADCTRHIPEGVFDYYKTTLERIRDFVESPTQQTYDYVAALKLRKNMESAIRNAKLDLRMETIRRGSPHTLRLTKTDASYRKALAVWEGDCRLLNKMLRK